METGGHSLRAASRWMTSPILAYNILRVFLGGLVACAAAVKASEWVADAGGHASPSTLSWSSAALVELELIFGLWLVLGMYPIWTRRVAIAGFVLLAVIAFSKAIAGDPTCGCFGRTVEMRPWSAVVIDTTAVGSLWILHPSRFATRTRFPFVLVGLSGCGLILAVLGWGVATSGDGPDASHEVEPVFGTGSLQVTHEIRVPNAGASPAHITRVDTSCGCSVADYDKMDLAPGQSASVRVHVNLGPDGGHRRVKCVVHFSSGMQALHVLNAVGYPKISLADNISHVAFGLVPPGKKADRRIKVITHGRAGQPPPVVLGVTADHEDVEAVIHDGPSFAELDDVKATRRETQVTLTLPPQYDIGSRVITAHIRYSTGDSQRSLPIGLSWNVRNPYRLSPPRIIHRTANSTVQDAFESFEISSRANEPLRVLSIDVSTPHAQVRTQEQLSESSVRVSLRIATDFPGDALYATATVRTDHRSGAIAHVPIVCHK